MEEINLSQVSIDEFIRALEDKDIKKVKKFSYLVVNSVKINKKSEKKYQCHICNITFPGKKDIVLHNLKSHQPVNGVFQCRICEKKVKTLKMLQEHVRLMHKKGYSHDCDICGRRFRRPFEMRRHKCSKKNKNKVDTLIVHKPSESTKETDQLSDAHDFIEVKIERLSEGDYNENELNHDCDGKDLFQEPKAKKPKLNNNKKHESKSLKEELQDNSDYIEVKMERLSEDEDKENELNGDFDVFQDPVDTFVVQEPSESTKETDQFSDGNDYIAVKMEELSEDEDIDKEQEQILS